MAMSKSKGNKTPREWLKELHGWVGIVIALGALGVAYSAKMQARELAALSRAEVAKSTLSARLPKDYEVEIMSGATEMFPARITLLWDYQGYNVGEATLFFRQADYWVVLPDGRPMDLQHTVYTKDGKPLEFPLVIPAEEVLECTLRTEIPIAKHVYELLKNQYPIGSTTTRLSLRRYLGQFGIDLYGNPVLAVPGYIGDYCTIKKGRNSPDPFPRIVKHFYTVHNKRMSGSVDEYGALTREDAEELARNPEKLIGGWDEGRPVDPPTRP